MLTTALNVVVYADNDGWALTFNGTTNYVSLGRVSSVMGPNWRDTKSISLWIRPAADSVPVVATDPATGELIVGNDQPQTFGISRATISGQNKIWFWNLDANGPDFIGVDYVPGEWVHLAFVHAGVSLYAYKNGVLVGSKPSGPTQMPDASADGKLYLSGSGRTNPDRYFAGEIDEVSIWNVALNETTVNAWKLRQLDSSHPNWGDLAAYYQMSNGSGAILTDDSGHQKNGTLKGGMGDASWVPSAAFGTTSGQPVADAQSITVNEDESVDTILTGSDPDTDPLTYSVATPPAHGTLNGAAPNLVYHPNQDFAGADNFTFTVSDGALTSTPATVNITVNGVNDAPVAQDDTATTSVDRSVVVAVRLNDSDVDGDPLTVVTVGLASNGTTSSDGSNVTYSPAPGFTGGDTFTYSVSDGHDGQATAQVSVTVQEVAAAGWALAFDGTNDWVRLSRTRDMMGPGWENTKSVSLWLKPASPGEVPRYGDFGFCDVIFSDRPAWWGISQCRYRESDRIWIWNYDGSFDLIGVSYTVGDWVQIGFVHEGGVITAYKNGVAVGSVQSGATRQPSTGALPILQFGGLIHSASQVFPFQGQIDEVRIWSRALNSTEFAQTVTQPLHGDESGLAAYYQMSDGAGTSLTDNDTDNTTDYLQTEWAGTLMDGSPPSVPGDGQPAAWVASGALRLPGAVAAASEGETIVLHIDDASRVELPSFTGSVVEGKVELTWTTHREFFNEGFNLYRAASDSVYEQINGELIRTQGSDDTIHHYRFTDEPGDGVYSYKLEDLNEHGVTASYGPISVTIGAETDQGEFNLFLPSILN